MPRSILPSSPFPIALAAVVAAACAPAQKATAPAAAPTASASAAAPIVSVPASAPPSPKRCGYAVRKISAYGRGAMRPQIAASGDAFAVAWEETTDHRSIRVETFARDGQPLGPSIEVADVSKSAAAPVVAPSGDGSGFVVFWSTSADGGVAALELRRIDRFGRPKSDVLPILSAPGARALDVAATADGWSLAWWNWSGTPHQLAVSFVDKEGRVVGRPLPVTRAPSPDPTVDIAPGAALGRAAPTVLAWDESIDGVDHVIVGDLGRDRLEGRTDLGPGATPRMGAGVLVFERPAETSIWSVPLAGASAPVRLTDGHVPAAAPRAPGVTAFCWLRDTDPSEEAHVDELTCGDLVDGKVGDGTRIAVEPRGMFDLGVAVAAGRIGAAWQTQSEDDTSVSFAALNCPEVVAVAKARE